LLLATIVGGDTADQGILDITRADRTTSKRDHRWRKYIGVDVFERGRRCFGEGSSESFWRVTPGASTLSFLPCYILTPFCVERNHDEFSAAFQVLKIVLEGLRHKVTFHIIQIVFEPCNSGMP